MEQAFYVLLLHCEKNPDKRFTLMPGLIHGDADEYKK